MQRIQHLKAVVLATVALAAPSALADVGDDFFRPDLVDAQLAEAMNFGPTAHEGAPIINGFWTDLVNTENVEQDGTGTYVAVLDTGLVPQWPFFFSQANIAWNLGKGFSHDISWDNNAGLVIGAVRDDRGFTTQLASGHGTHVTSTVVGFNLNNQAWVPGVAPHTTIIPVLVLDAWRVPTPFGDIELSGGTDAMIAAGIIYVADLADSLDGPVVINMSLGGPDRSAQIEAAVDYAIAHGVTVVASAGNSGATGMGYPGGLSQIISVGAAGWADMFTAWWTGDAPEKLNKKDALGNSSALYLEDFSSRPNMDLDQKHQDLDVSAPGAWVVGPYKSDFANDLNYYFLSGTSMASPHVAGIAALVLQANPDLSQGEMEALLENAAAGNPLPASDATVTFPFSAEGSYTATWDGGDFGAGFLQADAAISRATR
jgi:subtilisin family serine protease